MVLLTAVAAAETLIETTGLAVTIKWPNDILVSGRKIGGILLEMAVEMDAVDYMVIGLGLNVNTPVEQFPDVIRDRATSILVETGKPFPRAVLLRRFLERLEDDYNAFRDAGFGPIITRWKGLTDMVGRQALVQTISGSYRGIVADFDQEGFLILRDEQGIEKRLFSGDVTILEGGRG